MNYFKWNKLYHWDSQFVSRNVVSNQRTVHEFTAQQLQTMHFCFIREHLQFSRLNRIVEKSMLEKSIDKKLIAEQLFNCINLNFKRKTHQTIDDWIGQNGQKKNQLQNWCMYSSFRQINFMLSASFAENSTVWTCLPCFYLNVSFSVFIAIYVQSMLRLVTIFQWISQLICNGFCIVCEVISLRSIECFRIQPQWTTLNCSLCVVHFSF